MNFEDLACTTERSETRPEPAKSILENMDAILKELSGELIRINDAIYSTSHDRCDVSEPEDECFLGTLNRQRNLAESLLKIAIHIREGLW